MDVVTTRFLARLPPALARSFSAEQLEAIHHAFGMRYRMDHAIDLRRTLSLPWGRFYVVFLAGPDHRRDRTPRSLGGRLGALFDAIGLAGVAAIMVVGLLIVGQALTGLFAPSDFVALAGR